jgi:glutathione S-transferase
MLTLYSYPSLFGVADNNGYGLKVFAFMRLAGLAFEQVHTVDTSTAPRGQLPYLTDHDESVGDSDTIIAYLTQKYHLRLDAELTAAQRNICIWVSRLLDDLYWVMSYSRWQDERYWPDFSAALRRECPDLSAAALSQAREYNRQRYFYQGIGRYQADAAYARGIADLQVLADLVPAQGFVFGDRPTSLDAALYGFLANIHFYDIDTPLKQCLKNHPNLVRHHLEIHQKITAERLGSHSRQCSGAIQPN